MTHCVLLETETKDQQRRIALHEGELQLQPQVRSCDGLFQVFLLTKVLGIVMSDHNLTEKSNELEREVDKVHTELGFSFIDASSRSAPEPTKARIILAILVWIEKNLERKVPTSSTHLVQNTLEELKSLFYERDDHMRSDVQDRCHREDGVHRASVTPCSVNSTYAKPSPEMDEKEGTSESISNPVFQQKARSTESITGTDDKEDLFETKASFRTDKVICQSGGPTISNRSSARRKQKDQSNMLGVAPELMDCTRSLSELKKEFYLQHQRAKRRRRHKHDVVSGKGEKAKMQNEGYLELIRSNAPFFRAMNTGDCDTDLDEKRRLAYCICLKVVGRGGCFLGKDNKPMETHKAFKRVMTSLKDWRKPGGKKSKGTKKSQKKTLPYPKLNHTGESDQTRDPVIVRSHNPNDKLTGFKFESHVDKDEPKETEDPTIMNQYHLNEELTDLNFDFHTHEDVPQGVDVPQGDVVSTKEGQKIKQVIPDQLLSESQMMSVTSNHSTDFLLGSFFDIHDDMSLNIL